MTISSKEKDKENVQKNNNKDKDGGVPSAKEVGEQDSLNLSCVTIKL